VLLDTGVPTLALIRDSDISTADVGLCSEVVYAKFTASNTMTYFDIIKLPTMHDPGL